MTGSGTVKLMDDSDGWLAGWVACAGKLDRKAFMVAEAPRSGRKGDSSLPSEPAAAGMKSATIIATTTTTARQNPVSFICSLSSGKQRLRHARYHFRLLAGWAIPNRTLSR